MGLTMDMPSLAREAAQCRKQAVEFADRPEGPFLLQLASALEELALDQAGLDLGAGSRKAPVPN